MDEALAASGMRRDPRPQGKVIGDLHIVNQDVFSRRDWWFQAFNVLHRTTRPESLRVELLMKPGDPYDVALVEETIRNLQAPPSLVLAGTAFAPPELSSVVAIVPVAAGRPGTVDVLVVTRDIWSLRFNTDFEYQQNTLSFLSSSLSENNLFGWRKYLSVGFILDQGRMGVGPTYFDPNMHGTHVTLYASALAWYARDQPSHEGHQEGHYEGNAQTVSVRYPLYSLASRWGGGIDVNHEDAVIRTFLGNQLRLQDVLLDSGVVEPIPSIYRRHISTVDTFAVRSFGTTYIQRVTVGYLVDQRSSEVLPDFSEPFPGAGAAGAFLEQFAPISERRSEPYLRYNIFLARYGVFRDLDTFDLRESRQLGPNLALRIGYGLQALGADFEALALAITGTWAVSGSGGGYSEVTASSAARLRDRAFIDQRNSASGFAATPMLWRAVRFVGSAEASTVRADTARGLFLLGGSTGLRGYAIGEFQGPTRVIAHAEARSAPVAVVSQRFGFLLFYDVGDATSRFSSVVARQDLGAGLRWLIPQLNSSVLRFDWAFATQATALTRAGWPGRFTAGFQQAF